jgi:hypothetical protein
LNSKAEFESVSSHLSFKRLVPGAFNVSFDRGNLRRPTQTDVAVANTACVGFDDVAPRVVLGAAAQVEFESKT